MLRCTPNFHNLIFTSCIGNIPLWKERKTVMKWGKTNCGDQRNCGNRLFFFNWCGNRLEKEIKMKKLKKKRKEKKVRFVKNYKKKKKKTQTNKLIISTMSKEMNLSEIWDGDQVNKKLRQSKSMCKETKKICKTFMR